MPGQRLAAADLRVVRVTLAEVGPRYLSAATPLTAGQVVVRAVPSGDLVPRSALGVAADVGVRPVAVPVDLAAVEGLRPGDVVDVWVADRARGSGGADGAYDDPRVVARGAEVVSVSRDQGVLSTGGEQAARLLLADEVIPAVLSAVNNQARVSLVPVPGSSVGAGS